METAATGIVVTAMAMEVVATAAAMAHRVVMVVTVVKTMLAPLAPLLILINKLLLGQRITLRTLVMLLALRTLMRCMADTMGMWLGIHITILKQQSDSHQRPGPLLTPRRHRIQLPQLDLTLARTMRYVLDLDLVMY